MTYLYKNNEINEKYINDEMTLRKLGLYRYYYNKNFFSIEKAISFICLYYGNNGDNRMDKMTEDELSKVIDNKILINNKILFLKV